MYFYIVLEGKRHEAGMLRDSLLLNDLDINAFTRNGNPLRLYGDPAYILRVHLQSPFSDTKLTQQLKDFNNSMSSVRVLLSGFLVKTFKCLYFKQNLKLGLSSVGKMYVVATLMENAHTCLYENLTSEYFNIYLPTLQNYFS